MGAPAKKTGIRVKFKGMLVKILFPKDTPHIMGTYAITKMRVTQSIEGPLTRGQVVSVLGNMPRLECHEKNKKSEDGDDSITFYVVEAEEEYDSTWGAQYRVREMHMDIPLETPEDQKKFLEKVLTASQVEKLFAFSKNPILLLEQKDIETLTKIKGISESKAQKLIEKYFSTVDKAGAYVSLGDYGLTTRAINKLIRAYHSSDIAIARIEENPYVLIREVRGYGWKKADEIAKKKGITSDDPRRVKAYTQYYLEEQCETNGHSWMDVNVLLTAVQTECLPITDEKLMDVVREMLTEEVESHYYSIDEDSMDEDNGMGARIITEKGPLLVYDKENQRMGLSRYYKVEKDVAENLFRIQTSESSIHFDKEKCSEIINQVEEEQGFRYTEEQRNAIWNILNNQVSVLTGKAGCVDGETEFYSQDGWKKIKDFKWGDKVMQYNPTGSGSISLVEPELYHKEKQEKVIHFKVKDIISECLVDIKVTENHTVSFADWNKRQGCWTRMTALELIKKYEENPKYFQHCYFVSSSDLEHISFITMYGLEYEEEKTSDGYEYCFTVPSHEWFARYNGRIIVTGNCGKSYTVNAIVKILKAYDKEPEMCALSGRASSKLGEITHLKGKTIHKLLGYNPKLGGFLYDEECRLATDMVILDEASMVGGELFARLVKAIPNGAKFLMVGDIAQLESIGMGNVLKDCMSSGVISTNTLTKIHRQAQQSGIITESLRVSQGQPAFSADATLDGEFRGELRDLKFVTFSDYNLAQKKILDEYKELYEKKGVPASDIRVIVPMRVRGNISCRCLNEEIQKIVNGKPTFFEKKMEYSDNGTKWTVTYREGDLIIITKNNYEAHRPNGEKIEIFNGNVGCIKEIRGNHMIVDLTQQGEVELTDEDLKDINLAYCLTCHKIQGDSCKYAIVGLSTAEYALFSRELLYTAITRARKYCAVVVQNKAFFSAIKISRIKLKQTWLKGFLQKLFLTSTPESDIIES